MRKILTFCILFSLLFQCFSRIIIIADYYTNTDSYAKICLNKAFPKLHCNGKCQMMKKILQEEKNEQKNAERREDLRNYVLSSNSFFGVIECPLFRYLSSSKINPSYNPNPTDRCFDIFHPPQV